MRKQLYTVLILAALVSTALASGPAATTSDTRQYVVEMAGARAGTLTTSFRQEGSNYRSRYRMQLTMRRGSVEISIELGSEFLETADGEPLEMSLDQKLGAQRVRTTWKFEGDSVRVTTLQGGQGGQEISSVEPRPEGDWLTPGQVQKLWERKLAEGVEEITYRMIDAQLGLQPAEVRHELRGREVYRHDGVDLPVTVWDTTTDVMPIPGIEKHAEDGTLVYQEASMGMGTMVTRLATAADLAGAGGPAPEIMVETFVRPNGTMPDVGDTTAATLRLRAREGGLPSLPSAGAQRVETGDDGSLLLRIDLSRPVPASGDEIEDPDFLASTGMINADDPLIREMTERATLGAGDDPSSRAEALRRAVNRLVDEKGLDTGFATASEVARLRRGDCSEHAVLLCAMLRAAGMPSRVAIGLIYAESFLGHEDIFGWHMWTQALIEGRWIDLDATLPRPYHAGHVLTATSSLAGGAVDTEIASAVLLMGNLEIDVVDVERD